MAKCGLCGKNEGETIHIRAGLLYVPRHGPLDVCVCRACVAERACPGKCTGGYLRPESGSGTDRVPCPVCGGRAAFDYEDVD